MQYVNIDRTGLTVSRLGFGTASLHHRFTRRQRLRLLAVAYSSGISHFDTSPYYGFGLAELDLGQFIRGKRDKITIATKIGLYPPGRMVGSNAALWLRKCLGKVYPKLTLPLVNWHVQRAENSLHMSLKRLSTDYIDVLFLHEPNPPLIDSDEFISFLERSRSSGKIRYWGLAGNAEQFISWIEIGHALSSIIQCKDSLFKKQADIVLNHRRKLQFTYGYLSKNNDAELRRSAEVLLAQALSRNKSGCVLVSTRRENRIQSLTQVVM